MMQPVGDEEITRQAGLRGLPRRRESTTRSFVVGGTKGCMTTSAYENGDLAEVTLRMAKQGSTRAGVMDALSTAWSVGLQHGGAARGLRAQVVQQQGPAVGYDG